MAERTTQHACWPITSNYAQYKSTPHNLSLDPINCTVTVLNVQPLRSMYSHCAQCTVTALNVQSLRSMYSNCAQCTVTALNVQSLCSLCSHRSHHRVTALTVQSPPSPCSHRAHCTVRCLACNEAARGSEINLTVFS